MLPGCNRIFRNLIFCILCSNHNTLHRGGATGSPGKIFMQRLSTFQQSWARGICSRHQDRVVRWNTVCAKKSRQAKKKWFTRNVLTFFLNNILLIFSKVVCTRCIGLYSECKKLWIQATHLFYFQEAPKYTHFSKNYIFG